MRPALQSANDVRAIAARRKSATRMSLLATSDSICREKKDTFRIRSRCLPQSIPKEFAVSASAARAWAFPSKPHDQLGSKMQGIRGACRRSRKKTSFAAAAEGGCGFLRELRDPARSIRRKKLCLTRALFLELAANLFGRPRSLQPSKARFFLRGGRTTRRVALRVSMTSFAASAIAAKS